MIVTANYYAWSTLYCTSVPAWKNVTNLS
jgi:hypothetical protein